MRYAARLSDIQARRLRTPDKVAICRSPITGTNKGVPQDSVFGHMLFNLIINELNVLFYTRMQIQFV